MARFGTIDDARATLEATGYLADDSVATVVFLGDALGKPILLEGPAGTGKTELARAFAESTGARLIRLQCYEGLDEARALYEWNYRKQLLRIQATQDSDAQGEDQDWRGVHDDIFSEEFLLERPLLAAIRSEEPVVLLIDETDKADVEVEGLLLEILSDFAVTIPELGTVKARHTPFVVLTSNATRELSEALKRRCLYAHVNYPDPERERAILHSRVPEVSDQLAVDIVRAIQVMRDMDLRKAPSIAETIDWARALNALGVTELDRAQIERTLGVVVKHEPDRQRVVDNLRLKEGE